MSKRDRVVRFFERLIGMVPMPPVFRWDLVEFHRHQEGEAADEVVVASSQPAEVVAAFGLDDEDDLTVHLIMLADLLSEDPARRRWIQTGGVA